jgi:hypothetical protein
MTGYFDNHNEVYKIVVKGNGQTIYFAYDNDELVGVKKTESSGINIFIKERKPGLITYLNSVSGKFYPPLELSVHDLLLKNFRWLDKLRPLQPSDIFVWKN